MLDVASKGTPSVHWLLLRMSVKSRLPAFIAEIISSRFFLFRPFLGFNLVGTTRTDDSCTYSLCRYLGALYGTCTRGTWYTAAPVLLDYTSTQVYTSDT